MDLLLSDVTTFGLRHILSLVISLALVVFLFILAKKKNLTIKKATDIMFIVGIISETLKVFTYIVRNESSLHGYLPKGDLPFHLCSIQIIFLLILKLTSSEKTKRFLYSFMAPTCLFGGLLAMVLATWSSRNVWIITFQYFGYHAGIMIYSLLLFTSKEINFNVKDYVNCLIMFVAIAFIAIYLNSIVFDLSEGLEGTSNVNFMYIINPPMEDLPFLNKDHGWLVYACHLVSTAVLIFTLCYIKPIIDFFKSLKRKNKEEINTNE